MCSYYYHSFNIFVFYHNFFRAMNTEKCFIYSCNTNQFAVHTVKGKKSEVKFLRINFFPIQYAYELFH